MTYLNTLKFLCPNVLREAYSIPKCFILSEDDEIVKVRNNIGLYNRLPREFGNAELMRLSGVMHSLNYTKEKLSKEKPMGGNFSNYLHYFLKRHL